MEWLNRNKVWVGTSAVILIAAYVFYFANSNIAVSMFSNAWFLAVPLVLGAMVGVIGERSGVVNIGIEGQMLVRASGFVAGPPGCSSRGRTSPRRAMSSTGTTTWRSSALRVPASTMATSRSGPAPPRKRAIVSRGFWVADRPMRCAGAAPSATSASPART